MKGDAPLLRYSATTSEEIVPKQSDVYRRIVSYAAEQFERRGISAVTMDDIASGLGISKKTLYQHFASKEELASGALDQTFRDIGAELLAARRAAGDDFSAWLRGHLWVVAERYGRLQTSLLFDLSRNQPTLYEHYLTLSRKTIERNFASLLREGARLGEFRADLDPKIVISALITLSMHMAKPETLTSLRLSPRQAFEAVIDLLLQGLRVRKQAKPSRAQVAARKRAAT